MEIPYGYCHCGCGQKTNIAPKNNTKARQKKGEPYRYLKAHNIRRSDQQYIVDDKGCWIWQWSKINTGYGKLWDGTKLVLAHRWYYEQCCGEIPKGKFLCHTCDVRSCVNPDHLFVGTQADNLRDMREKGRANRPVKLSDEQVQEIRERLARGGERQKDIGSDYGVTQSLVSQIKTSRRRSG